MRKSKLVIYVAIAYCIFLVVFYYQSPVLTSGEAVLLAVDYLQNPPEEYGNHLESFQQIEDIQYELYRAQLLPKQGFVAELLNHRQWEVTIYYDGMEPTVVMDAITGEFLTIYGPLN